MQVGSRLREEPHFEIVEDIDAARSGESTIVGTTTIVRSLGRDAARASRSFGSGRGGTCEVTNRLSRLIASSLTGMSTTKRDQPRAGGQCAPWRQA